MMKIKILFDSLRTTALAEFPSPAESVGILPSPITASRSHTKTQDEYHSPSGILGNPRESKRNPWATHLSAGEAVSHKGYTH
jgi:hypothetical protein